MKYISIVLVALFLLTGLTCAASSWAEAKAERIAQGQVPADVFGNMLLQAGYTNVTVTPIDYNFIQVDVKVPQSLAKDELRAVVIGILKHVPEIPTGLTVDNMVAMEIRLIRPDNTVAASTTTNNVIIKPEDLVDPSVEYFGVVDTVSTDHQWGATPTEVTETVLFS